MISAYDTYGTYQPSTSPPNLPMMICCATARWKLPTKTSVYADKQWLFLILQPPALTFSLALILR